MASSAEEVPAEDEDVTMTEPNDVSSPKELRNALYARCASFEVGHVFNQDELFAFKIIPDNSVEQLLAYTKQLAKDGLFKLMTKDGKACWKVVKRADAVKYRSLSQEEALVYSYIEGAAREGIWSKTLRNKTNLHMTTMNRAVKSLETKNMIKAVKVAKYPNRKTYMLAKLQPSEDVTGGPFYTNGELDEEFVHQMSSWTERYIIAKSWYHPPLPEHKKRSSSNMTQEEAEERPSLPQHKKTKPTREQAGEHTPVSEHKKNSSSKMTQEQAEELRAAEFQKRGHGRPRSKAMIPMHPGYRGYPTLSEVTRAINKSGLSNVTMKESEMQQLLDVLYWDGRLERMRDGKAYRATKQVHGEDGVEVGNGLTEAPCGRCPVFDLCEEDGPVNARSCEYFEEWLLQF